MQWFRFYSEALDDPKVQRLPGDLFKAWVNLLCLANEQGERGTLPSIADLAFRLRVDELKAEDAVSGLVRAGLLEYDEDGVLRVHAWEKRQPPSDIDSTAAERKRRERQRKQAVTRDVTRDNRDSHGRVTGHVTRLEKSREEESKEYSPPTPQTSEEGRAVPAKVATISKTRRDEVWDALVEGTGISPQTSSERSRFGKSVAELLALDATRPEILCRCQHYKQHYPNAALTDRALVNNWSSVAAVPDRPSTQRRMTQAEMNNGKTRKFVS